MSNQLCTTQGMLVNTPKRYYEKQDRLHIYDGGSRNSYSGVMATMFGGTGNLGSVTGGMLTSMGSQMIYPYRNVASIWDNRLKELKPSADLGYKTFVRLTDFTSEKEVAYALKDSNTVISTIGSKSMWRNQNDFEDSNIRIPMAIAKAVKNNPRIKRFIHISAAGADPNSHSQRLRTKWIGEQEVKAIYPDVTILRPTLIMNLINQDATIAGKWGV
jgi:NADH dehydrogenase (ubiquinone) 1 alpha subcomplex subunit 9